MIELPATLTQLQHRQQRLEQKLQPLQQKLEMIRNARLMSGLLLVASVIACVVFRLLPWPLPSVLVFLTLLLFLVRLSRKLQTHIKQMQLHRDFYSRQILRAQGCIPENPLHSFWESQLPGDAQEPLQRDLQLTGPHSLLAFLDECASYKGWLNLRNWLLQPELHKIAYKHQTLKNLSVLRGFALRVKALTQNYDWQQKPQELLFFLESEFLPNSFHSTYKGLKALWLLQLGTTAVFLLNHNQLFLIPLGAYLFLTFLSLQLVKPAFTRSQNIDIHLSALAILFKKFAQADHPKLKEFVPLLSSQKPLQILTQIKKINRALSVQAHPIVFLAINSLLPFGFFFAAALEKKRREANLLLPTALKEFYEFDAFNSLVFIFSHINNRLPTLKNEPQLSFRNLVHPLIPRTQVVANNFEFAQNEKLALITGSNMAGKSTFLRSIGINQVLACAGAPVWADDFQTFAASVMTAIQVTDLPTQNWSKFYNEVQMLKNIFTQAKNHNILYLIDEIFQGTNNEERRIGSLAVISTLAQTNSLGFITTHDLELTKDHAKNIVNYHFSDQVDAGVMRFPYRIEKGVSTSTNALKIMAEAGLVPPKSVT